MVNGLFLKKSNLQHCRQLFSKSLFSLKIFTPQTSKHYSLNTVWRLLYLTRVFTKRIKKEEFDINFCCPWTFVCCLLKHSRSFWATFCRSCALFQNRTKYWIRYQSFIETNKNYCATMLHQSNSKISSTLFEKNCSFGTKDLNNLD